MTTDVPCGARFDAAAHARRMREQGSWIDRTVESSSPGT
jgi:hypothetical protein